MADKENKDQEQPQQGQLNIELNEDVADGIYSNLAIITHSNAEFVIDFIAVMPGTPKARVKSRILVTPQHAKRLARALQENISKFESVNGTIEETDPPTAVPMNFGGQTGQA